MMAIKVNDAGVEFAEQLLEDGKYRINTVWREAQPSDTKLQGYFEQHGPDEYARWFLGVNPDETDPKTRYTFPIGDFKSVHRSALNIAKQRAEGQYADIADAADELISFFDRISAC